MYINDILSVIIYVQRLLHTFKPNATNSITNNISDYLSSIVRWCSKWAMEFSAEKCEIITYRCNLSHGPLSI